MARVSKASTTEKNPAEYQAGAKRAKAARSTVAKQLGGLIESAEMTGSHSLVSRRVVAMFHFTLAESSRGLRVTRGLTNLSSQSVPVDRIQGVRLCQPVLWRPFGWWRVDVDIHVNIDLIGVGDAVAVVVAPHLGPAA